MAIGDTKEIFGEDAIDLARTLSGEHEFIEIEGGYCCDAGYWGGNPVERDEAWLYWNLLNNRNRAENISIKYTEDQFGSVNWDQTVWVFIETEPSPERATIQFIISPIEYDGEVECEGCIPKKECDRCDD